jgi:hypothetical protein
MTVYTIPRANAPISGSDAPSREWYNYLKYLSTLTSPDDLQTEIDALQKQVNAIKGGFTLKTIDSIAMTGSSEGGGLVQLSLVNDSNAPGNVMSYSTDLSGNQGWHPTLDLFTIMAYT